MISIFITKSSHKYLEIEIAEINTRNFLLNEINYFMGLVRGTNYSLQSQKIIRFREERNWLK